MDSDDNPLQKLCESDSDDNSSRVQHKYFGIKSYLHNFYENVSFKNPTESDDFDEDYPAIEERKCVRVNFWKVTLLLGIGSMVIGAFLLLAGFLVPTMNIDIGYQEEMRIIDKSALEFNQFLEVIKVAGLILFAVSGSLVAAALLLPSLLPNSTGQDKQSNHFKLRIEDSGEPLGCTKNLIPVTEELKVMQPRQVDNTVITNAGLKRIDLE